jgi:hypothetical protein
MNMITSTNDESLDSKETGEEVVEQSTEQAEQEDQAEAEDSGEKAEGEEEKADLVAEKPKKLGGFQKKLAKFEAQLQSTKQEIEFWKQKALGTEEKPSAKVETTEKPKIDDFDTQAEFLEALTDWKLEQKSKAEKEEQKKNEVKTEFHKKQETYQSKLQETKKELKDFDEVIEDFIGEHGDLELSGALNELIMSSEYGPKALYELAKNKAELDRLNSLSPLAAAKEFGKLESSLAPIKKTELKLTTSAPKPISTVSTNKATVKKSLNDPSLSFSEWEKLRNEEIKKAQKRA